MTHRKSAVISTKTLRNLSVSFNKRKEQSVEKRELQDGTIELCVTYQTRALANHTRTFKTEESYQDFIERHGSETKNDFHFITDLIMALDCSDEAIAKEQAMTAEKHARMGY